MTKVSVPTSQHAAQVAATLTGAPVLKLYRAEIELDDEDQTAEICGDSYAYVAAPSAEAAVDQVVAMITEQIHEGNLEQGHWRIYLKASRMAEHGLVVWRKKSASVFRNIGDVSDTTDLTELDADDDDDDE